MDILNSFQAKFETNFNSCFEHLDKEKMRKIEIHFRAICLLGEKVCESSSSILVHQKELTRNFDEIFADFNIAIYLASLALDKPAYIILRRAFELSIATVYLWDLPHEFWGWKENNLDLSFSNMIKHIKSSNYTNFIREENKQFISDEVINYNESKEIYSLLSNIMHGRVTTFETTLETKFSYDKTDWELFVERTEKIIKIIFSLWNNKFPKAYTQMLEDLPAKKIIDNEK